MSLERKNQDENIEEYLDEKIIDLMDSYNLDRDTAEEVHLIMIDLDLGAKEAMEVYTALEKQGGENA